MTTMSSNVISPADLAELCASGRKIDLIDVRTPIEFREVHVEIAAPAEASHNQYSKEVGHENSRFIDTGHALQRLCRQSFQRAEDHSRHNGRKDIRRLGTDYL